jgi:hypothetical protein
VRLHQAHEEETGLREVRVSTVELFFDLVFGLAITQLTNAVPPREPLRVLMLLAVGGSLVVAMAITAAWSASPGGSTPMPTPRRRHRPGRPRHHGGAAVAGRSSGSGDPRAPPASCTLQQHQPGR